MTEAHLANVSLGLSMDYDDYIVQIRQALSNSSEQKFQHEIEKDGSDMKVSWKKWTESDVKVSIVITLDPELATSFL